MPTSIIIDLIIVAVLALSIYLGWTKGIVRGLLTLAGMILAFFIASQIGDIVSGLIVEQVIRPAAHTAIEQRVLELDPNEFISTPIEEIERTIDAIENDLIREKVKELLSSVDLPTELLTGAARDTVLEKSLELVDTVLRGAVRDAVSAILCILCFAVLSLALRPVIWMIEQAFKLPILRQINQFGGLFFGTARGILLVLIAVWALRLMGMYVTDDVIAESVLLKYAAQCLDVIGSSGTTAARPFF